MADYKRFTKETERVFLVAITGMPTEVAKAKEAVEKVRLPPSFPTSARQETLTILPTSPPLSACAKRRLGLHPLPPDRQGPNPTQRDASEDHQAQLVIQGQVLAAVRRQENPWETGNAQDLWSGSKAQGRGGHHGRPGDDGG